jgi:purine-binding chemotaxis protein CheW
MEHPSPGPDPSVELLTFAVGGQDYALDVRSVREIRGLTPISPLPRSPDYLPGVINLRGGVLPILDLARRLGLPDAAAESSARDVIIVVEDQGQATGLLVSAVSDILTLHRSAMEPPPGARSDDWISAVAIVEERMVRILSLPALLPRSAGRRCGDRLTCPPPQPPQPPGPHRPAPRRHASRSRPPSSAGSRRWPNGTPALPLPMARRGLSPRASSNACAVSALQMSTATWPRS